MFDLNFQLTVGLRIINKEKQPSIYYMRVDAGTVVKNEGIERIY